MFISSPFFPGQFAIASPAWQSRQLK